MPAGDDLDQSVRRSDPDRWLASRFIANAADRADVLAICAFDHELARAMRVTSNMLLAEIRLTWWHEALGEIFEGRSVRRHPVAQALAAAVARHDHPRAPLEAMIDARLAPPDDPRALADAIDGSATLLALRTLDAAAAPEAAALAGRVIGLTRLAREGRGPIDLAGPLAEAAAAARGLSPAAFPAIACATLARARDPSPLEVRARLFWAVLSGRL